MTAGNMGKIRSQRKGSHILGHIALRNGSRSLTPTLPPSGTNLPTTTPKTKTKSTAYLLGSNSNPETT